MKREKLLAALPTHDWNWTKAAIAAGYKRYYAKAGLITRLRKDVNFCKRVDELRAHIERKGDIEGAELVDRCIKLLDDKTTPKGVQARLLETLMKYKGMLTERRIIENVDRTKELTEAQEAEAKRLTALRFRPTG